jgi:hypothetical protein
MVMVPELVVVLVVVLLPDSPMAKVRGSIAQAVPLRMAKIANAMTNLSLSPRKAGCRSV